MTVIIFTIHSQTQIIFTNQKPALYNIFFVSEFASSLLFKYNNPSSGKATSSKLIIVNTADVIFTLKIVPNIHIQNNSAAKVYFKYLYTFLYFSFDNFSFLMHFYWFTTVIKFILITVEFQFNLSFLLNKQYPLHILQPIPSKADLHPYL